MSERTTMPPESSVFNHPSYVSRINFIFLFYSTLEYCFGNYACNVSTCPEHETTAKGTVLAGGESLLFLSSMVVEPPAIDVRKSVGVVSPCMCNNRSITLISYDSRRTHDQIIRLPSDQQMLPPPFSIQFTTSLEPAP